MTKGSKKPKWTGQDFKRARRAAESLYYYRMNKGDVEGKLMQDYRGPIPPRDYNAAEYQLAHTPCFWHCVSITYCKDYWGKPYRLWGFAKTQEQLKIIKDPLDPLLKSAQMVAEDKANEKHFVGRGFILAPWNKQHPDLFPLLKKHAKELELTQSDLDGIKDYLQDEATLMEYDPGDALSPEERNNIDAQIAKYI